MLFHSTRGNDSGKDFATILMQGLADDGGLFMPDHWPQVDLEEIKSQTSFVDITHIWSTRCVNSSGPEQQNERLKAILTSKIP